VGTVDLEGRTGVDVRTDEDDGVVVDLDGLDLDGHDGDVVDTDERERRRDGVELVGGDGDAGHDVLLDWLIELSYHACGNLYTPVRKELARLHGRTPDPVPGGRAMVLLYQPL